MANQTGYRATTKFPHLESSDFCDHTSYDDHSKAVGYFYEEDSFGPVGHYIVCEGCRDKIKLEARETIVCCHDCRLTVKTKDSISWTPYDYYPAQGDLPTIVCTACTTLPKHQERVARDKADYDNEFPNDSFDDCDDDGRDDDDDDMEAFFAKECAPEEEPPVVLLDIELFRGRYFDNANRSPCSQNWSKCITGIKIVFN